MWYGQRARHRQDACATSFTSEMETLYMPNVTLECGGKVDYETENSLADRVGWRKGRSWLSYDDLTFNKQAQEGHLPSWRCVGGFSRNGGLCSWGSSLASRTVSCSL
jgi:hypothetical protein